MVNDAGRLLAELVNVYDGQRRIAILLPQLVKEGISPELNAAIDLYIKQTDGCMAVIEKITAYLGQTVLHTTSGLLLGDDEKAQEFDRALSLTATLMKIVEKVQFPHIESHDNHEQWEAVAGCHLLGWAQDPDSVEISDFIRDILDHETFLKMAAKPSPPM